MLSTLPIAVGHVEASGGMSLEEEGQPPLASEASEVGVG